METKREWTTIKEYEEILFDFYNGIARITINRERYRNAFTPTTTTEMSDALYICRERPDINVVVLTGAGDTAFCAGGDMHVKGHGGYIGKSAKRKHVKFGFFAANTMHRKHSTWVS